MTTRISKATTWTRPKRIPKAAALSDQREATCPLYGISPLALADLFRLDVEVAAAWKARLRKNAEDAKAVALLASRDLGAFDPRWSGFVMARGVLWTPENFSVHPGEVRALPHMHAQIAENERHQRWMVETSLGERRAARDQDAARELLQRAIELLRQQ
jgi:hypothetical protein